MIFSIVVAMSKNRVIGREGKLPWKLSTDLKWFKHITEGHTLVMGRKTAESVGKALPNRLNLVLSQSGSKLSDDFHVYTDWPSLLNFVQKDAKEVFIIGGEQIFNLLLNKQIVSRMYISHVETEIEGDTFFPEINWDEWQLIERNYVPADEKNEYSFYKCIYQRI